MSGKPFAATWVASAVKKPDWTVRVIEPEDDDRALVEAAQRGDTTAFDVLVERHRRTIYQVCYRFVNNHEDASDLAQEAFLRAWKGLDRFKAASAFSTWLYRIAVNVCLTHVGARRLPVEPLASDRFVDPAAEPPGAALRQHERATAVQQAIARLPDKQRTTLILRAYHDLTHQEIADVLGSSVGAVKANFFHALANLKRLLGPEP
jgi:RNA polymerase sigma-70 factor, ECF subfamily